MRELDPSRTALLALDFQNYGIHPEGYWAKHGEPDWPAIARPAAEQTARVLEVARRHRVLVVHVGVTWRAGSPDMNMTAPPLRGSGGPLGGGDVGIRVLRTRSAHSSETRNDEGTNP